MSEPVPLPDELEQLLDERGWMSDGDPRREGPALRLRVTNADGEPRLLYWWDEPLQARRAARAYEADRAGHLFAVPDLVEAGVCWLMVSDIAGVPLAEYLAEAGASLSSLEQERARVLIRGIGELTRKLHEVEVEDSFGDLLADGEIDPDSPGYLGRWHTFNGYGAARLEHLTDAINRRDFAEPVRRRLLNSIGDLRHELSAFHPRHPSSLNHGRLCLDHLWVDQAGQKIVGMTGLEHARLLPAEADLAFFLWLDGIASDDELVRDFHAGYGAARTMDLQRRERFYRRLAAFEVLCGGSTRGDFSAEELVELTTPAGLV